MGVLSGPIEHSQPKRRRPEYPVVEVRPGDPIHHRGTGRSGSIVAVDPNWVTFIDGEGREHRERNDRGGFTVDGIHVSLVRAASRPESVTVRTASGSVAVPDAPSRMARASRILVEGVHDAELIEQVWGDDLRIEGVVVEPLHGADDLATVVRTFGPRPGRRLGVLLDHLVEGTKEQRIAAEIDHPDVLVCGHPYVDVWQCIRPSTAGIAAWPRIERGTDWKTGVCAALGFEPEPGVVWKRLLGTVRSYADLEPPFVGAVEQLIDFVTND